MLCCCCFAKAEHASSLKPTTFTLQHHSTDWKSFLFYLDLISPAADHYYKSSHVSNTVSPQAQNYLKNWRVCVRACVCTWRA